MSPAPVIALWLLIAQGVFAEPLRFQSWFEGFGSYFQDKLHGACRPEYEAYLNNSKCQSCQADWPPDGSDRSGIIVVNCLLQNSEEYVKANLAVATVVLGLLPTVLSFSGSSLIEIGLLALRRPLLATVLSVACPSIYPLRAVDLENIKTPLEAERTSFKFAEIRSTFTSRVVGILEYVLALGAAANTGTQIWTLCIKSISALGPSFIYWVPFWPLTAVLMYLLGTLHVSLCAKVVPGTKSLKQRLSMEFSPCAAQLGFATVARPVNYLATLLAWTLSVLTVVQIVYGTMALSSLLFVPVFDAVFVGLRFIASAAVARAIVDYELSGMKSS